MSLLNHYRRRRYNRLISLVTWGSSGGPFPRLMRWLAKGLAAKGRRVDIVFIQNHKGFVKVTDQICEIGLGTRARYAILPLIRYFREQRPSLVIATPVHVAVFSVLAGRFSGTPVVPQEVTFMSLDKPFLPGPMKVIGPILRRLLWPRAAAVAAVSRDVALEVHKDLGLEKVLLLPNPCEPDEIRSLSKENPVQNQNQRYQTLVMVGRLIHQKGVDVLLRTLHLLVRRGIDGWELKILGDGPQRQDYEELAKVLGLGHRVKFLGYVSNPYPLMAAADIFVHPSRWEGFGMVIVEAMALGLPVVATTCPGGPKDILEDGKYGILVPPDDAEGLANALERLMMDGEERERLGKLARERVEVYRPERIAEKVLEIEEYVWSKRSM